MDKFRLVILGAGNIANKMADAVKYVDEVELVAVGSKSMERAQAFAEKNGIPKAYDSYEKMLVEEKPDGAYIAVTVNGHYELSKLCLEHGVPILCEKTMYSTSAQAEEIFALAKEKNLFSMEAMWSRFLPAINKAKEWIGAGKIGEPIFGDFAYGFVAPEGNETRYWNPALGGGADYDLAVYGYELMTYLYDEPVEEAQTAAIFSESGVDATGHITLRFAKFLASIRTSFETNMDNKLEISGKKGRVCVPKPIFAEDTYLYNSKGEMVEHFHDDVTQNGFMYELQEFVKCVRAGVLESDRVPHALTLACAKVFDKLLNVC